MSEFDDRVRDSEVVHDLRRVVYLISEELSPRRWEHQRTVDLVGRAAEASSSVLARLTLVSANLITESMLDGLRRPVARILETVGQMTTYANSDEPDHGFVNGQIDELLHNASTLPVVPIRTTPLVLQRAASRFDDRVTSSTAMLAERINAMESQASAAETYVREAVSEFQGAAGDLTARVADATDRLERNVTDIHENHREAEQKRASEFIETQLTRDAQFHEAHNDVMSLRDQARRMLELVAGASTGTHYSAEERRQSRTADRWRWLAVASFVLLGVLVLVMYVLQVKDEETLSAVALLGRYSTALPLAALATYAIKQSGHHRKREQDISRVANEMLLLWPFLDRVPEGERTELLRDIAPSYFKGGLTAQDAGDSNPLMNHGVQLPGRRRTRQTNAADQG